MKRYLVLFGYGAIAAVLWFVALCALVAFFVGGILVLEFGTIAVLQSLGYSWDVSQLTWWDVWSPTLTSLGVTIAFVPVGVFAGVGAAEATNRFRSFRKLITNSESFAAK